MTVDQTAGGATGDEPRTVSQAYLASLTEDELEAFLAEARATSKGKVAAGRELYARLHEGQAPTGSDRGRDLYRKAGRW